MLSGGVMCRPTQGVNVYGGGVGTRVSKKRRLALIEAA